MATCSFTAAGSAVAARELGYRHVAELVLEKGFSPARIAALFRSSASRSARRDLAFVILVGSIARYRAQPQGWVGEPEATIARQLIGIDSDGLSNEAARFVEGRWRQIEGMALSGADAAA